MSRITISSLKSRFETGDRPNGQDYVDLIDTLISQSTDLGTGGNNDHIVYGIENQTTLETLNASEWRLVKYLISISKTVDGENKFYATELSILIDQDSINVSEYGVVDNDGDMGTIDVSRSGNLLTLSIIPNPIVKPVTVRFARIGLKA